MLVVVRVLVVEDDTRMAAAIRRALRGAGVLADGTWGLVESVNTDNLAGAADQAARLANLVRTLSLP